MDIPQSLLVDDRVEEEDSEEDEETDDEEEDSDEEEGEDEGDEEFNNLPELTEKERTDAELEFAKFMVGDWLVGDDAPATFTEKQWDHALKKYLRGVREEKAQTLAEEESPNHDQVMGEVEMEEAQGGGPSNQPDMDADGDQVMGEVE